MSVNCDYKELVRYRDNLEKLEKKLPKLCDELAREIAEDFLRNAVKRIPQTNSNELRNNLLKNELIVEHKGNDYIVKIKCDVEYASYIEYGYKKNGRWINGYYFMTLAGKEVENKLNSMTEKKIFSMLNRL